MTDQEQHKSIAVAREYISNTEINSFIHGEFELLRLRLYHAVGRALIHFRGMRNEEDDVMITITIEPTQELRRNDEL